MRCLTIGNPGNPGNPWEEKLPKMTEKSSPKKSTKKNQLRVGGFFTEFATTLFFFWTVSSIDNTFPNWIQLSYKNRAYMDVSENNGTPKSSILIGISIINHAFWGTPIYGNPVGWVLCLRSSGNFVINKRVGKVSRLRWLDEVESSRWIPFWESLGLGTIIFINKKGKHLFKQLGCCSFWGLIWDFSISSDGRLVLMLKMAISLGDDWFFGGASRYLFL